MAINLQKGERKTINSAKFTVGLSWKPNETSTGVDFDLDASVFLMNSQRRVTKEENFIFYNNPSTSNGSVVHSGDCKTGESSNDGDDETIIIDTALLDADVEEILIVVTIHDAQERNQNFGQVRDSLVRVYSDDNSFEEIKYELDEDYSIETAMEFARIYKKNNEWKIEAVGNGQREGLDKYVETYAPGL